MKTLLIAAAALSVLASAGAAEAQSYQGRPGGQGGYQGQGQGQGGYQGRRDGQGQGQGGGYGQGDGYGQGGYGPGQGGYGQGGYQGGYGQHNGYGRGYDDRGRRGYSQWERRSDRRYNAGHYHGPRGYAQRQWRRGEYLPPQYRGRDYYVDHRTYHLPPPPRGYQYTRVDDDVVLTAIATGLIASIVFEMFQ